MSGELFNLGRNSYNLIKLVRPVNRASKNDATQES